MRAKTPHPLPAPAGKARSETPETACRSVAPATPQPQRRQARQKCGRKVGKKAAGSRLGKRSCKDAGKRQRPSTSKSAAGNSPLRSICCGYAPRWEITEKRPRSISGVELAGNRIVRNVYLDESGISGNESITLVAGVIINEDTQWKALEKHILGLIEEYVPAQHRDGFSFHAKDLFHCSGKIFGHAKTGYPRERAREALKELLSIPRRFNLPVSVGYFESKDFWLKAGQRTLPTFKARDKASLFHSLAYALCVVAAETYMVSQCGADDLARLVAENNTTTQFAVKTTHKVLQGKFNPEWLDWVCQLAGVNRRCLPLNRIVDTVHFAEKDDAPLLQLADVCAFIFRYWAEGKSGQYIDEYYDAFTGGDSHNALGRPPVAACQRTWVFDEPGVAS